MKKIIKMTVFVFLVSVLFQGTFFIGTKSTKAASPGDVVISEFAVAGGCPEPGVDEWYEVLNTTESDIDLEGWTIDRFIPDDSISLSGILPAQGILVFSVECVESNNSGDVLVINDGSDDIFAVSYGNQDPGGMPHSPGPIASESAQMIGGVWSVTSTNISKGWFNYDPENPFNPSNPEAGGAPRLSELDSFIESQAGVVTNLGELENPSESEGLYFEKEGIGKLKLSGILNLTDRSTFELLIGIGEALLIDMDEVEEKSIIGLNASTAENLRTAGAELFLYGMNAFGIDSVELVNMVVYDDEGFEINPEDDSYPTIEFGDYNSEENGGTLVFSTDHFTSFEVSMADIVPPTALWAKITGGNEITIKFSELIDTAEINILDFTNLLITDGELEDDPREITDMDVGESDGTEIVVLTFGGDAVGEDATGLISMNFMPFTIQDMSGNEMEGVANFPVTDGQGSNTKITNTTGSVDVQGESGGTLDVSALITGLEGELPGITINSDIGSGVIVKVQIPEGVTVTGGAGWDGKINIPTFKANSSVTGVSGTISKVIEIGANDIPLSFDKGIRILIPGQSGKNAGYYRNGVFTPIAATCSTDSQEAGDALAANGNCKINSGSDLVIWTKHLTSFVTYTASSGGGSYSPGGGSSSSSPESEDEEDGEVTILPVIQGAQMQFRQQVQVQLSEEEKARRAELMKGTYEWQYITQSPYPPNLQPGEEVEVWVEVKNIGTATWFNNGDNVVRLGSGSKYGGESRKQDYASEFANSNWYSANRPANIIHPEVRPGWHTRFQFIIKAPATDGIYKAYFTPVIDGIKWMNDIGLYWEVRVGDVSAPEGQPQQPANIPATNQYIVQAGDYMALISAKTGVSIQDLVDRNKSKYPTLATNPSLILVGWVLEY